MKTLAIAILLLPSLVLATPVFMSKECPSEVREEDKNYIERHFEAASDIVFVKVVKTEMDNGAIIDFKAKVVEAYKGNASGKIDIRSGWEIFDIITGGHYIFFLYNENVIDRCNINIHLGQFPTNLFRLENALDNPERFKKIELQVLKTIVGDKGVP